MAAFSGSLSISTADVNGDSVADIIVGAGSGGGPRLAVFNGATGAPIFDAFMYESYFTGGIHVSAGTLNGQTDIVIGAGVLGGPRVRVLDPTTWKTTQDFFAYDSSQRDGVQATIYSPSVGGTAAIVTVDGPNETGAIAAFDASTLTPLTAPALPGLPGGAPLTTMTAPTFTSPPPVSPPPTSPPPISLTDDSGMVNSLPDVNASNWVTQSDGLKIWDVQTGTGTAVTSSSTLSVYYTGWLLNGTSFDSARSPNSPASFSLTGLIQGWQEGLIGMQPGGIRRLYIPSALAYGTAGSGSSIPPNSDIVFEIKLISVTNPAVNDVSFSQSDRSEPSDRIADAGPAETLARFCWVAPIRISRKSARVRLRKRLL